MPPGSLGSPEPQDEKESFQRFIDALQKHQQALSVCSQHEQQVVEALSAVEIPTIAEALKHNFPFLGVSPKADVCFNESCASNGKSSEPAASWTAQYLNAQEQHDVAIGDEALRKGIVELSRVPTMDSHHPQHFFNKTFSEELRRMYSYFAAVEGAMWSHSFQRVLASRCFELLCTFIMLTNVIGMIVRLEIEGILAGEQLGVLKNTGMSRNVLDAMENIEIFFTLWFTVELLLRIWVHGCRAMLSDAMGAFDIIVVVGTLADLLMTRLLAFDGGMNLTVARMVRLVKVLKFLRTFKAAAAFTELRILLRTVLRSTMALLWALIVLSLTIVTSSNFMAQLLGGFIANDSNNFETRLWVYEQYGTATRAAWTMFQATLSGGWPNYAHILVVDVNPLWALWWFFYVIAVIFAVIRVIGALFLTASLKAANEDHDMQALVRIKDFTQCGRQLRNIFKSPELMTEINDHTVDLTPERMAELDKERAQNILRADMEYILSRPQSIHLLNRFGFETVEIRLLFDILAHGADKVEWELFLKACMRLKGGVKGIDVIEILYAVERSSGNAPRPQARRPEQISASP